MYLGWQLRSSKQQIIVRVVTSRLHFYNERLKWALQQLMFPSFRYMNKAETEEQGHHGKYFTHFMRPLVLLKVTVTQYSVIEGRDLVQIQLPYPKMPTYLR